MHALDVIRGNDDEIELVLLVAAYIAVAHHIEDEVVVARHVRSRELQLHLPHRIATHLIGRVK